MRKIFLFTIGLVLSLLSFAQNIDVQHYDFDLLLSDQSDVVIGKAYIEIKFPEASSQFSLDLGNEEDGKGMQTIGVYEKGLPLQFTHGNDKLVITTNAKAGEVKIFEVQYTGIPKDGLIISKNKYGQRTFFADNWPNRAHDWIPCNDRPDDKASFEFTVTAPSRYRVVSNGTRTEEKDMGNGTKRTHWQEAIALSTKVMVIGVAEFAVKEYEDSPKNIPVTAWIFPQDSAQGFFDYSPAPEIVQFFSSYIAPYPYEKLANVQSKTIFGGMENASAIFYSENSVTGKGTVEDLLAHEIAHQWFGDMASEKSFAHLWLSEGFATYLTNIYIEKKYGKDSLMKRMEEDRQQVIQFAKRYDHPVVDTTSSFMELLNANSYQKGGWVLHMLRNEVGDSVFHKIIQTYYGQYKGANADTRDFEAVAENVSGKDLKWFFDQWLYRPGVPELIVTKKFENGEMKVKITQVGNVYKLPLTIRINREQGRLVLEKIILTDRETEIKWKGKPGGLVDITVDPYCELLFNEIK